MKKKTNNQIREEVRKSLASKYKQDVEAINKQKAKLGAMYNEEVKKNQALREENQELKQKVEAIEDWNKRLLEFMDMDETERKNAYQRYVADSKFNDIISQYTSMFNHLFHF